MAAILSRPQCVNTLRLRQNGLHFPDDVFNCVFLNENVWISNKISLKFVPKGQINHFPALVQIMAWRRTGYKPLSEPMMVILLTHVCVTLPQWVNSTRKIHGELGQWHGCWCPDALHHKVLISHAIVYMVNRSLSSTRKDFNYLPLCRAGKWYKGKYIMFLK